MKRRRLFHSALSTTVIAVACPVLAANLATAASATWNGSTDANWSTGGNWSGGAAVGSTTAGTAETATFNTNPANGTSTPLAIDVTYRLGNILFDTAAAGAFVIGSNAGNQLTFGTNHTGLTASIIMNPTVAASQEIAAPLLINWYGSGGNNSAFLLRNNAAGSSAVLKLSGAMNATYSGNRAARMTLDGTNTGNNIISGAMNFANGIVGIANLTKNGAGTWILSGANTFSGTALTSANPTWGIQINAGVLVAANSNALGSTGGSVNNYINNGGTLELNSNHNGSIALNDGLTLQLMNGGTIRSDGSNTTNSKINVSNAAGVGSTLSAVNVADVFTVGNGANDVTGGASDSVLHIGGAGTVLLANASNYAGAWSVDAGVLRLGSPAALGTLASVNVASGAKLQTFGVSIALKSLTGSGAVTNDTDGSVTLTANIASSDTFAGQLQNGVAGTLGFVKTGAGTLNLSGAGSYTEATTISTGVLNLTGSLGNTAVSGSPGATLSGNGTITGGVTADSNVHIAPGDGGDAAIGTLTVGTLALNPDSQLDFGITNTTTLDKINVTASGGLSISGGQVNINGGLTEFTTNGTYPLISHTGPAIAGISSLLSVNGLNKSVTKTYTFTDVGGFVNLVVANSGVAQTFWNLNADGDWNLNSNWTPATAPNAVGAFAGFGGGGTEITADRTITVNGAFTVGTLALNGAANAKSYMLAAGSGANITLNNGGSGSFVTNSSGSHTINPPLTLTSNGATFTVLNPADTLTVGGDIGGEGAPLVKGGAGTLVLSGSNTYLADTTINAGTVQINSAASLGDPSFYTTINAGTLRTTADITSSRIFSFGDLASTLSVDSGTTFTVSGAITDGANPGVLNKAGGGTLVLGGFNYHTGGTVINAGTVQVNNANSLGNAAGMVTINSATLQAIATFTGSRNVNLGSASSDISVDPGLTYTINGTISGSGTLNKSGTGTLTLGAANTYSGGTSLNVGTLAVNNATAAGTGTVTAADGTTISVLNGLGANSFISPITLSGTNANVILTNNNASGGYAGAVAGNADQTLTISGAGGTGVNLNAAGQQLANFHGTVSIPSGQYLIFRATNLNNGSPNAQFVVDGFISTRNGGTLSLGALSGSGNLGMGGNGGVNQALTYSIGALGFNSTFSGVIQDNDAVNGKIVNLIKAGFGTQTLSGTNTYTGATTIDAGGTLQIGDGGTTGSISTTSVVNNNGTLAYNRSDSLTVGYLINGSGSVSAIGTGTTTFASIGNGFTGGMTIDNGATVNINSTWQLGGAGYGGLTFDAGGGTLQYATTLLNSATDLTQDTSDGGLGENGNPRNVTLTGDATIDTNGHDVLYKDTFGNGGAGGLTKIGSGTLTLAGANTYTGATSVNAGTLALAGGSQASAITVNNAGTSLGFTLGSTTSSTSAVTFGAGTTVRITGTPTLAIYTLMTASSFQGITPVLDTPIAGYTLSVTGGNSLVLVQSGGGGYFSWADSKNLTASNNGSIQDPDFDGIPNELEFLLGGNPLASDTGRLPVLTTNATNFIFTFNRADESEAEIGLTFEWGTNLTGWTPIAIGSATTAPVTITENDASPDTVVVAIPKTNAVNGKLFGRLKAVR